MKMIKNMTIYKRLTPLEYFPAETIFRLVSCVFVPVRGYASRITASKGNAFTSGSVRCISAEKGLWSIEVTNFPEISIESEFFYLQYLESNRWHDVEGMSPFHIKLTPWVQDVTYIGGSALEEDISELTPDVNAKTIEGSFMQFVISSTFSGGAISVPLNSVKVVGYTITKDNGEVIYGQRQSIDCIIDIPFRSGYEKMDYTVTVVNPKNNSTSLPKTGIIEISVMSEIPSSVRNILCDVKQYDPPVVGLDLKVSEKQLARTIFSGEYILDLGWDPPLVQTNGTPLTVLIKQYMVKVYHLSSALNSSQISDLQSMDISEVVSRQTVLRAETMYTQTNSPILKPDNTELDVSGSKDLRSVSVLCKWSDYVLVAVYPVTSLGVWGKALSYYIDVRELLYGGEKIKDLYENSIKEYTTESLEDNNLYAFSLSEKTPGVAYVSHCEKEYEKILVKGNFEDLPKNGLLYWEFYIKWTDNSTFTLEQEATSIDGWVEFEKPSKGSRIWSDEDTCSATIRTRVRNPFNNTVSQYSPALSVDVWKYINKDFEKLSYDLTDLIPSVSDATGLESMTKDMCVVGTIPSIPNSTPLLWSCTCKWFGVDSSEAEPVTETSGTSLMNKIYMQKPASGSTVWDESGKGQVAIYVSAKSPFTDTQTEISEKVIKEIYRYKDKEVEDLLSEGFGIFKLKFKDTQFPAITSIDGKSKDHDEVIIRYEFVSGYEHAPISWEIDYYWGPSNAPIGKEIVRTTEKYLSIKKPKASSSVWSETGMGLLTVRVKAVNPFTNTSTSYSAGVSSEIFVDKDSLSAGNDSLVEVMKVSLEGKTPSSPVLRGLEAGQNLVRVEMRMPGLLAGLAFMWEVKYSWIKGSTIYDSGTISSTNSFVTIQKPTEIEDLWGEDGSCTLSVAVKAFNPFTMSASNLTSEVTTPAYILKSETAVSTDETILKLDLTDIDPSDISVYGSETGNELITAACKISAGNVSSALMWIFTYKWGNEAVTTIKSMTNQVNFSKPKSSSTVWSEDGRCTLILTAKAYNPYTSTSSNVINSQIDVERGLALQTTSKLDLSSLDVDFTERSASVSILSGVDHLSKDIHVVASLDTAGLAIPIVWTYTYGFGGSLSTKVSTSNVESFAKPPSLSSVWITSGTNAHTTFKVFVSAYNPFTKTSTELSAEASSSDVSPFADVNAVEIVEALTGNTAAMEAFTTAFTSNAVLVSALKTAFIAKTNEETPTQTGDATGDGTGEGA